SPNQVASVQTGADEWMMVFDCLENDFRGIPAIQPAFARRTMRMDADGNAVAGAELVETIEAVRVGTGTEHLQSQGFAKVENALVGIMVLGESLHAESPGLNAILLAKVEKGLLLLGTGVQRNVLRKEFSILQSERLGPLERAFKVEIAERIGLH